MVQVVHKSLSDHNLTDKDGRAEKVLEKMHAASIEEQASLLAAKHGLRYIDLNIFPIDDESTLLAKAEDARRLKAAIFQRQNGILCVALTTPGNPETLDFFKNIADEHGLQIEFFIVSSPSLEKALTVYDKKPLLLESLDLMRVTLSGNDLEKFEADFGELLSLKDGAAHTSTSRIIEIILAGANKLRASDIHIEPNEDNVRLRYRIDGLLQEIGYLPTSVYRLGLSRIKMISKMKLNIRDRAQDGHFFIELDGERIDIRVNIIPGNHGESVNMRLLTGKEAFVPVDELGLRGRAYEEVERQISKPHGMILNTGPTGSGKTTTLYSLLNSINDAALKIITIEDPIEYALPGVVQTEVSKNKDYTFAQALRAIVRQDPDVILVGEVRDEETADVSINAALTGHLVFTTLHTNSAAASIARLMELGAKPSAIATAANIFIAQRLVRILCSKCKIAYEPAQKTVAAIQKILSFIPPKAGVKAPETITTLYKPAGCEYCNFSGYRGRKGIFEVFPVNEKMSALISSVATENDIRTAAIEDGMLTMSQDGILKVIDGLTTMDEVWRSAGKEESFQSLYDDILADKNMVTKKKEPTKK